MNPSLPTSTFHPPNVIHMISIPRPSTLSPLFCSHVLLQPKNKKRGRSGNEDSLNGYPVPLSLKPYTLKNFVVIIFCERMKRFCSLFFCVTIVWCVHHIPLQCNVMVPNLMSEDQLAKFIHCGSFIVYSMWLRLHLQVAYKTHANSIQMISIPRPSTLSPLFCSHVLLQPKNKKRGRSGNEDSLNGYPVPLSLKPYTLKNFVVIIFCERMKRFCSLFFCVTIVWCVHHIPLQCNVMVPNLMSEDQLAKFIHCGSFIVYSMWLRLHLQVAYKTHANSIQMISIPRPSILSPLFCSHVLLQPKNKKRGRSGNEDSLNGYPVPLSLKPYTLKNFVVIIFCERMKRFCSLFFCVTIVWCVHHIPLQCNVMVPNLMSEDQLAKFIHCGSFIVYSMWLRLHLQVAYKTHDHSSNFSL